MKLTNCATEQIYFFTHFNHKIIYFINRVFIIIKKNIKSPLYAELNKSNLSDILTDQQSFLLFIVG